MQTSNNLPVLTVIGCRAGSPGASSAASGYVLRSGETTVLIDCGPGVVLGLAQAGIASTLNAVINTHAHADHCADLVALAYHRLFPDRLNPLPLFGTRHLDRVIRLLDEAFGIPSLPALKTPLRSALPLTVVQPGESFVAAGLRIDTLPMTHPVPTMALRFPDIGFVFTSDGALTDDLVEFARDASCLLCEATYPTADGHNLKQHGHMTASQAGELAARANVIQLVVTHLSRESDSTSTLHAAHAAFQKEALLAYPGLSVTIAQRALSAPQSGRLWP